MAEKGLHKELRLLFRKYYENSLRNLGYSKFDYRPIKHYYDIIFASKSKTGIEFWKKANSINYKGQRELLL
ncbi:MAG: hypothetical protein U5P10_09535 [Spirochaetia bacterium]|nr:hypothetical protein [Spirochaetia bacterium]